MRKCDTQYNSFPTKSRDPNGPNNSIKTDSQTREVLLSKSSSELQISSSAACPSTTPQINHDYRQGGWLGVEWPLITRSRKTCKSATTTKLRGVDRFIRKVSSWFPTDLTFMASLSDCRLPITNPVACSLMNCSGLEFEHFGCLDSVKSTEKRSHYLV